MLGTTLTQQKYDTDLYLGTHFFPNKNNMQNLT